MIQIGLFRSKGFVSSLIKLQTRSPYSHAALILPDNGVIEAWPSGVRQTLLGDGHGKGTQVDLFNVAGVGPLKEADVLRFAREQIGKPYDFSSVIRFVTRCQESREARGHWFCSELVAASYQHAGVNLLERIEPWAISPGVLSYSPLLVPAGTIYV